MKKLLFFLAALMFVASCAKDTTTTPEVKGEKVVSFKVTAPKIQTRYGEGAEANQLFWAVYKNGQRLDDISVIDPAEAVAINMSVDVEISLMEGIDYDILFWAQNENAPYTFDGAKVTIDYNALSANKEAYDAFFRNYHVDADQTEPHRVELRRPFAQLNIGTADTAKAQSAGFTLENTSVTVEACTVLDLATGEASEPQELTFAMSQKASDTYGDDPDTFDIISMNYLLVNNEKKVVDVTFNAEGGNDAIEREYLNVPLQRNHRTYILGDILTSSKLFNVYINPAFEDEDLFPEYAIYYTSSDGEIVEPHNKNVFGANIVSNTYENGQGKIIFDGMVTAIGDYAFDCCNLIDITIPKSVTYIGACAFETCTLTNITIPENVTYIGDFAFWDCIDLQSITIHNDIAELEIGDCIAGNCPNLEAFYGPYVSEDNRCLIVDGVLKAFAPAGLATYSIPDNTTTIGAYAFHCCSELIEITMPESVTTIEDNAFYDFRSLTRINIPNSVTTIGDNAFMDCDNLTSINIPNSLTSIGSGAFSGCESLTEVYIPNSVVEIGEAVFSSSRLTAFYGKWASEDNRCLIVDGTLNSFAPVGLTTYSIPDNVIKIGRSAFAACDNLTSVTLPDSVTEIGDNAFLNCSSLEDIVIPDNVTYIGAFAFFSCYSLLNMFCKPTTPPTIGDRAFYYNNHSIFVPTESVESYKAADSWKAYVATIRGYNFE